MFLAPLFLIFMAYLLYRFRLVKVETRREALQLIPVFAFFGLFLLAVGVFALFDRDRTLEPKTLLPVRSIATFRDIAENGERVLFVGPASASMADEDGYAAYYGDGDISRPEGIILALEDGDFTFDGRDYQILNWRSTDSEDRYLRPGDRVVVVGMVRDSVSMSDGGALQGVEAETVYAGSYERFIALVERSALFPLLTAVLSFVLGAVVLVGPPLYVLRRFH